MREDMYKTMAPAGKQAFPALFVKQEREREGRRVGGYGQSFPPLSECFSPFQLFRDDDDGRQHFIFGSPFCFFFFNFPCKRRTFPPRSYGRILAPFAAFIWSAQTKTRFSTSSDLLTFPFFVCQSKRLTSQFLLLSSAFHIKVEHCVVCVSCFSFFFF